MLVYLEKSLLFDSFSSASLAKKMRRLITSNVKLVEFYLSYFREKVAEHKIFLKLAKLTLEWDSIPLDHREEMLNKIDNQTH